MSLQAIALNNVTVLLEIVSCHANTSLLLRLKIGSSTVKGVCPTISY
ncbi:MAG TPA: hypothetical protein V6D33_08805 [Cyanophyceae cyanobacterium]